MKANADSFSLERWYEGNDKRPVFVVRWEQSWSEEGDDEGERERKFRTLDAALRFGMRLLSASIEIGRSFL